MVSSKARTGAPVWIERQVGVQRWEYADLGAAGTRGTILWLHGFPDAPVHWLPVAEALATAGYRCIVPYLPGYGGSDPLPAGHDVQSLAESALAFMADLSPETWYVVGHDWGAVMTYAVCALAPGRVRAAVTLAVPPLASFQRNLLRHPSQLRRSWYMGYFQLLRRPEAALADPEGVLLTRLWRDWSPAIADVSPYVAEVQRALNTPQKIAAALGYYRALLGRTAGGFALWRSNYHLIGQKLGVPTRILVGEQDGCVAAAIFEGSAAAFIRADLCDVQACADAGHFMQLEEPQWVAQQIQNWFASVQ